MAALGNITIAKAGGTNVVFSPVGLNGGLATYRARAETSDLIGQKTLTISVTPPSKSSALFKVRAKITVPVLDTPTEPDASGFTPAPRKAYDVSADVVFLLPSASSQAARDDAYTLLRNLLVDEALENAVSELESIY